MNYQKLLEMMYSNLPNMLFGVGIFFLFWIFSKIIQLMIRNFLTSKNPDTNISRVISGIIKNIMTIYILNNGK